MTLLLRFTCSLKRARKECLQTENVPLVNEIIYVPMEMMTDRVEKVSKTSDYKKKCRVTKKKATQFWRTLPSDLPRQTPPADRIRQDHGHGQAHGAGHPELPGGGRLGHGGNGPDQQLREGAGVGAFAPPPRDSAAGCREGAQRKSMGPAPLRQASQHNQASDAGSPAQSLLTPEGVPPEKILLIAGGSSAQETPHLSFF